MSAHDFEKAAKKVVDSHFPHGRIRIDLKTPAEARLHKQKITQAQKELRLIKKEVRAEISKVNSDDTTERAQVGKGFTSGIMASVFGKKAVGQANASKKD